MTDWQPIETAPKDATAVLLWPDIPVCIYRGNAPAEIVLGYYLPVDREWYNPERQHTFDPTHWMPLPEPPQEGGKE
jgi:hypothetical protein